jgi:hypothetical protein
MHSGSASSPVASDASSEALSSRNSRLALRSCSSSGAGVCISGAGTLVSRRQEQGQRGGRRRRDDAGRVAALVDATGRYLERFSEPGALTAALNRYRAVRHLQNAGRSRHPRCASGAPATLESARPRRAGSTPCGSPYRFEVLDDVSHWISEEAGARSSALRWITWPASQSPPDRRHRAGRIVAAEPLLVVQLSCAERCERRTVPAETRTTRPRGSCAGRRRRSSRARSVAGACLP